MYRIPTFAASWMHLLDEKLSRGSANTNAYFATACVYFSLAMGVWARDFSIGSIHIGDFACFFTDAFHRVLALITMLGLMLMIESLSTIPNALMGMGRAALCVAFMFIAFLIGYWLPAAAIALLAACAIGYAFFLVRKLTLM